MEEKLPNNEQIALLNKYLTGEITDDEIRAAENLISSDEICKAYWNNILLLQETIVAPEIAKNINSEKAYKKFIQATQSKPKNNVRKIYFNILKAAAIIIFVLTIWRVNYYFSYEKLQIFASGENQNVNFVLPDGSKVELNSNSTLKYPKKFKKDIREIYFKGEAYFNIQSDAKQPFIINAKNIQVKVLGTAFNLFAYEENEEIKLTVDTGFVILSYLPKKQIKEINKEILTEISAGENIIVNKETAEIIKTEVENKNYIAWKTKLIDFKEASLQEVVEVLNNTYNINITIKNEEITNCKLTANFNNRPISFIFEILKINFNLEIVEEGENFIFIGEGCENK